MRRSIVIAGIPTVGLFLAAGTPAVADGWVNFSDETSVRMPVGPGLNDAGLTVNDNEEKDYAWGDVDNDGDIDLVCVRKQPFTSTGKDTNILFMNEGIAEGHGIDGVLVDRTAQYAVASDVPGDQGFLTATNDRDVVLVDLDLDGWLDMVTAPTLTDNQAKNLSHPRVYMNLGEVGGVWQGFRYEDARIPQMHPTAGPRFCSVAAGDVTGDGYPDLYFGDYDSGGGQIFDYNNKLLINDGNGFFSDESNSRLTSEMRLSAFGAASVIADINNDGVQDVVKQTSLNAPQHVAVTYNDPSNEGVFFEYDIVNQLAPYFVSADDLNNDGRLDLIVVDDGTDTYLLNQGWGQDGIANFTTLQFPGSGGFGGNSISADFNNDGFQDVVITDVDVDIPGCSRRTLIYRNLGNTPNVSFQEQGQVIPNAELEGVHDAAVFDINGDGWLDMVLGKCDGTQVWMNTPPTGLVFNYPNGVPSFLVPNQETTFQIEVSSFGGGTYQEGSALLFASIGGSAFAALPVEDLGNGVLEATLPALECPTRVRFYLSANLDGGGQFTDPPNAPAAFFNAISADGVETVLRDEMEDGVADWTATAAPAGGSGTSGEWEAVDPNGTISSGGLAAPEDDATAGAENVIAWVTENGVPGASAGFSDVDNLEVTLTSPVIDLAGSDATITFARWFFCDDAGTPAEDFFVTEVTSDGVNWVEVAELTTNSTNSAWETVSFVVGDYVEPSATVQVRFVTSDLPNNSLTEAGVDNFQVDTFICGAACVGDLDGDSSVGFSDLLQVLSAWGPCSGCAADLDGDGNAAFGDVLVLLAAWGACP